MKKDNQDKKEEISFEKATERLEEIVDLMESGDVDLDSMVKLFEEGRKLIAFCNKKLTEVERKVEKLTRSDDGSIKSEPFDEENV
ncbi:MAG: exodeoxyribonuclease VII small subunit [Lentisphaerae bacterium]|jgi:exodeoxyribonuclease VII small subunit|nr:exodeoxyribonuclease VII small subunit [Lentisphaerota bacterium]